VVGVERPIYDGREHTLRIVLPKDMLDDALAIPRLANDQAEAALLTVHAQRVEDFLLLSQQREPLVRERVLV